MKQNTQSTSNIIIEYTTCLGEPKSLVLSDRSQSEIDVIIRDLEQLECSDIRLEYKSKESLTFIPAEKPDGMPDITSVINDNLPKSVTFDTNVLKARFTPSEWAILQSIDLELKIADALGIQIGQKESRENKMTYELTSNDKRSIVQTAENSYKNIFEDDNIKDAKPRPSDLYNVSEHATIIEVEKMDAWINGSGDEQVQIEILVRIYIDGILTDWFDTFPTMYDD